MNKLSAPVRLLARIAPLFTLLACAVPHPTQAQALRARSGPYELEVLVSGVPAPTYAYQGETYVLGQAGSRYTLRIHNRTGRRIEAVVSVDGLDVIDGRPGDYARKRGYLVPAYGTVDIDGWRLSERKAAAFRFASVADSYAAKTGHARNVGVIGVAVFPERPRYVAPHIRAAAPRDGLGSGANSKGRAESAPPSAAPAGRAPSPSAAADEALAESAAQPKARRSRSGLGTEFGEAVSSEVREVPFRRQSPTQPAYVLGARYNDRAGLLALGIDVDGNACDADLALRQSAQPFPISERRYARPPAGWRGR